MSDVPEEILVRHRRNAPKYTAFIGTGVAIGVLIALAATFLIQVTPKPGEEPYSLQSVFGYTGLVLGLIGGLLGGLVAVIVDRRS